ncbi:MAG TPA: polysaccharide deacetylase family protein [Tepidisphaeraceae bacterium]|nr:polysaccharide deacetylase family protein [Tepidisphaeraceae bacterium]
MPKPTLRRRAFLGVQKAMYWTGSAAAYVRGRAVNGATILLYHSVPSAEVAQWIDPANAMSLEVFEAQMRFLARRRNVISMSELMEAIENAQSLEAGTVVITFDDGYRDNLEVAGPILERYGLSATLYLATNAMNEGHLWIDELYAMFCRRTRHELSFGAHPKADLADAKTRAEIYRSIADSLSRADLNQRREILIKVEEQLRPTAAPPRLMLNWNEVRELQKRFTKIEIGLHTADHLDLAANESAAHEQIERSRLDVERELGIKPKHFSFPYGRFSEHSQNAVREMGLQSAVVAGANCLIDFESSSLALARIVAPQSMALLGFWTSGAYPGLTRALFGRA